MEDKFNKLEWLSKDIDLPDIKKNLSPTQACGLVERCFLDTGDKHVGVSLGVSKNNLSRCWWNRDYPLVVKLKRKAYRLFCKHPENLQNWINYNKQKLVTPYWQQGRIVGSTFLQVFHLKLFLQQFGKKYKQSSIKEFTALSYRKWM